MENIKEQIKEKLGLKKETMIDVRETTLQAPFVISGARYFMSCWRFNFDPTPWDYWILLEGKLFPGDKIEDIIKQSKIEPKSEEESLNLKKLILFAEGKDREDYHKSPNPIPK